MDKKYKYHKISVYCEPAEMEKWGKLAKKQGIKLSNWIREAIIQNERFISNLSANDTQRSIVETPEIAELISENKVLKERVAELESLKLQKHIFDYSKILDCLSKKEWKSTSIIAQEAGLYSPNIFLQLDAAKAKNDVDEQQSILDILLKGNTEVEIYLNDISINAGGIESKKDKGRNTLWRLK